MIFLLILFSLQFHEKLNIQKSRYQIIFNYLVNKSQYLKNFFLLNIIRNFYIYFYEI